MKRDRSLSDLLMQRPLKLRETRQLVDQWVRKSGARAAFLVDETGQPFASVGRVDFERPPGLTTFASSDAKDAVLAAMVGQRVDEAGCHVEFVGERALLVTLGESEDIGRSSAIRETSESLQKAWSSLGS